MKTFHLKSLVAVLLFASLGFAYDLFLITDKYTYSANESIFAVGAVKINVTPISNLSAVFTVRDVSDTAVSTSTFVTNSSGQFNSTFSLTSAGNYTLVANVSGDVVKHFIKVLPYAKILLSLNRPSYTSGATGTVIVTAVDINSRGVASQGVTASIRTVNGTVVSTLSACTTDSLGQCQINFTAPTDDGIYVIEANNFEAGIALVVGGYDAFMKITPSIVGKDQNVTVRVTVKNANGNGISASTRQLVVTAANGTQTTITSMTPANDSSGSALTGVYEDKLKFNTEGTFEVKVTIQPQGSNLIRELRGAFEVRSYTLEVFPWQGSTSLFTPGQTVSLAVRLRNASSNEFMKTTQCGSGSCITSLNGATVLDPSNVATGYAMSVSEQTSLSLYRMDITVPATAKSGTYKVQISLNDSFGTGSGTGYFTVQLAKGSMRALDKFPGGLAKDVFLPGKQLVLEFSAKNASGAVNVSAISSYTIRDDKGNDKTSIFGTGTTYPGNDNKSYVNLSAPKQGGRYIVRAKLTTALGSVDAEGWFFIDVLEIEIRPQAIGGGQGGGFTPFGGPGYMFAFRPNDTVQLRTTVKTASESRGHGGFMGGGFEKGGSAGGGHSVGFGGMFGIGGGTAVQGGQVIVDKIINLNTEEDVTASTTITNCITDSTGICTLSLKSNVNGQNWTGGFHIVFVNVTTSDNQSDDGEGFFEVRRYMVNVQTRAATAKNASNAGFTTFNDWFVGPDDNINITITVIEPGTWSSISQNGNATIQGIFYGGNIGEFIFPPKLQSGTNATVNITNGAASAIINAPSGGWKSGFYIVKVIVNVSSVIDTGESFLMVKIYQGFGQPINPTTRQMDFTASSNENVSIQINVFDVKNNRPAANLTVTLSKILSFENFPPSEVSYDTSAVSTGTTDSNGQVVMTMSPPSGGWSTGDFLTNFGVTNGTVTDSITGFFQVKNFFVELSGAKWRFARNETVSFNVTISSDPSWMRQQFGGGCASGDPMCAGGGGGMGPPPAPSPSLQVNKIDIRFGEDLDLDSDGQKDINITNLSTPQSLFNITGNLTVINGTGSARTAIAANFWCADTTRCQRLPAPVGGNITNQFDSVDCDPAIAGSYSNATTHNMSGTSFFCVNTSTGKLFKVDLPDNNATHMTVRYVQHIAGSVGGVAPPNTTGTQGFSYYNATLKSIKVIKFDFATGESVLSQGVDYDLTSATGSTVGEGKIVIPGIGSFSLKPITTWSTGFYRVLAEFNTSATLSESGENGFSVETFFANCYRSTWGAVASGTGIAILCDIEDPGRPGYNYKAANVSITVESVRNIFTFQNIPSGASTWTSPTNHSSSADLAVRVNVNLSQNLGNGQYEAILRVNATPTDVKRQSVWFEVKDFDPVFYMSSWSYTSGQTPEIATYGIQNNQRIMVNLSASSGLPELVVYRYDKSTGAKTTVSGITIRNFTFVTDPNTNFIRLNKTQTGGWDEGSYEVVANITSVNATGALIGGKVEVRTWFEVSIFSVGGWSESWSNHPKSNVTLRVHVGAAGAWWQNYNGMVNATVTAVTNTQTGAVLTAVTHYNATNSSQNPSVSGELQLNITSDTRGNGLLIGTYRATVNVRDEASGKSAITDIWFEVRAFQFWVYTERYDYASSDDVLFLLNIYSPGGSNTTLTGARITYLSKCGSTTCSTVALSTLNTTFNATTNRLTILSTTGLTTGWYWAEIEVNDTQNATARNGASFQIKSFGVTGYLARPVPDRYAYYINESMTLNVTGTIGTNITNVTFRYWNCPPVGSCGEKRLERIIGQNLSDKNVLVNITPPGLNNTWPTGEWGWQWYNIEVSAKKDNDTATFWTGASVNFPWVWNITGLTSFGPSDNITANVTVYVDTNNLQRLANAIVNVSRVLSTATWTDINLTAGAWNQTGNVTDSNGFARVTVRPDINKFNWTLGSMVVQYTAKYGNASTQGNMWITAAQKTLNILGKSLTNAVGDTILNATRGVPFNVSVTIRNPESVAVTTNIRLINNALNASAQINNITVDGFNLTGVSIGSGTSSTFSFGLNVTGGTSNVTSKILFTPTTGGFASTSTTLTYRVN